MNPKRFTEEIFDFNNFLGKLPHKDKVIYKFLFFIDWIFKIFVAGNHEIEFNNLSQKEIQSYLTNCTYLLDNSIMIDWIKM